MSKNIILRSPWTFSPAARGNGAKWTPAPKGLRQWWDGPQCESYQSSALGDLGQEAQRSPACDPQPSQGRKQMTRAWQLLRFFLSILVKKQPHCHMCLEFDFQAKCQLFHAKTPSGFGPGSPAVKAQPFQYLNHLPERTASWNFGRHFWVTSSATGFHLQPWEAWLQGVWADNCADPAQQGSVFFPAGQEPLQIDSVSSSLL